MTNTLFIDNPDMTQTKEIYDVFVEDERINPERVHYGRIIDLGVRECKRKDNGGEFEMLDVIVRGSNGKLFTKSFSIDFTRKFLMQLDKKVEDIYNAAVLFSVDRQYKSKISFFAFIARDEEASADCGEDVYYIAKYENEGEDKESVLKKLKALGL